MALVWTAMCRGQRGATGTEWKAYGADEASTRYSALDVISRDNVKSLRVWCRSTPPAVPRAVVDAA